MKKVEICAILQNKYTLKSGKKIRKIGILQCLAMLFLVVNMVAITMIVDMSVKSDFAQSVVSVATPFNPLYKDESATIFTDGVLNSLKGSGDLKLVLPVHSSNTTVNGSEISMVVDTSIMVSSPEDGIVENIEDVNGQKTITIRHAKNVSTVISGVDVCGVVVGQKVAKGKDLGTAKMSSTVTMNVLVDGQSQNIVLDKNVVKWE